MTNLQPEGERIKELAAQMAKSPEVDVSANGNTTTVGNYESVASSATQSWGEGKLSAKKDNKGVSYTAHDDFTGHGGLTHYYRLRYPEDKSTEIEMVSAEEANNLFRTLLLSESSRIREEMVEEIEALKQSPMRFDRPLTAGGGAPDFKILHRNAGLDAAISVITKKG